MNIKGDFKQKFFDAAQRNDIRFLKAVFWQFAEKIAKDQKLLNKSLETAVMANSSDTYAFLANNGANIDFQDKKGRTALIFAAVTGNQDLLMDLCARGANPDAKDKYEMTAQDHAAEMGYGGIANYLATYKEDVYPVLAR